MNSSLCVTGAISSVLKTMAVSSMQKITFSNCSAVKYRHIAAIAKSEDEQEGSDQLSWLE